MQDSEGETRRERENRYWMEFRKCKMCGEGKDTIEREQCEIHMWKRGERDSILDERDIDEL